MCIRDRIYGVVQPRVIEWMRIYDDGLEEGHRLFLGSSFEMCIRDRFPAGDGDGGTRGEIPASHFEEVR